MKTALTNDEKTKYNNSLSRWQKFKGGAGLISGGIAGSVVGMVTRPFIRAYNDIQEFKNLENKGLTANLLQIGKTVLNFGVNTIVGVVKGVTSPFTSILKVLLIKNNNTGSFWGNFKIEGYEGIGNTDKSTIEMRDRELKKYVDRAQGILLPLTDPTPTANDAIREKMDLSVLQTYQSSGAPSLTPLTFISPHSSHMAQQGRHSITEVPTSHDDQPPPYEDEPPPYEGPTPPRRI